MTNTQTQQILRDFSLTRSEYTNLRVPLIRARLIQRHEKLRRDQYSEHDLSFIRMACGFFDHEHHNYVDASKQAVIQRFGENSIEYQTFLSAQSDAYKRTYEKSYEKRVQYTQEKINANLNKGAFPAHYSKSPLLLQMVMNRLHEQQVYNSLIAHLLPYVERMYNRRLRDYPIGMLFSIGGVSAEAGRGLIIDRIRSFVDCSTFNPNEIVVSYRNRLLNSLKRRLEIELNPIESEVGKFLTYPATTPRNMSILKTVIPSSNGRRKIKILRERFNISRERARQIKGVIIKEVSGRFGDDVQHLLKELTTSLPEIQLYQYRLISSDARTW